MQDDRLHLMTTKVSPCLTWAPCKNLEEMKQGHLDEYCSNCGCLGDSNGDGKIIANSLWVLDNEEWTCSECGSKRKYTSRMI